LVFSGIVDYRFFLSGAFTMLVLGLYWQSHLISSPDSCNLVRERSTAGMDQINERFCTAGSMPEKRTLYILGGAQESQLLKFQKAADLYKQGGIRTVWVMHVDGITTYDNALGRNPTEDEWTMRELNRVGIPPESIGFLMIESGLFGTFSEAQTLAAVYRENRIGTLLLVCAGYHARRVEITFSALLADVGVRIVIHPTDETASMVGLAYEFSKRKWYETVLIPLWQRKHLTHAQEEFQPMAVEHCRPVDVEVWG
jgi:uncharacterized SAM-binding protein YcdF (DUF218 family)